MSEKPIIYEVPKELRDELDAMRNAVLLAKRPTAVKICNKAAELVSGERNKTHGDKTRQHSCAAEYWSTYLSRRLKTPIRIDAHDVAMLSLLLKISRIQSGEHNPDNYVDMAGYAGCAGEIIDKLLNSVENNN